MVGGMGEQRFIYTGNLTSQFPVGMPCNFVSTAEVPTTIWQTLRTHTKKANHSTYLMTKFNTRPTQLFLLAINSYPALTFF